MAIFGTSNFALGDQSHIWLSSGHLSLNPGLDEYSVHFFVGPGQMTDIKEKEKTEWSEEMTISNEPYLQLHSFGVQSDICIHQLLYMLFIFHWVDWYHWVAKMRITKYIVTKLTIDRGWVFIQSQSVCWIFHRQLSVCLGWYCMKSSNQMRPENTWKRWLFSCLLSRECWGSCNALIITPLNTYIIPVQRIKTTRPDTDFKSK